MNGLQVRLLGDVEIYRDGTRIGPFPTQTARDLFTYLSLNDDRMHPREVLVDLFWGDRPEDRALANLRTTLWRVRGVVERGDDGVPHVRARDGKLGLNPESEIWVDVKEFERRARGIRSGDDAPVTDEEAGQLREAIDLYRGDLLEGSYADWCLFERERLRLVYLSALERLMVYEEARGAWDAALDLGGLILERDPLREDIHRRIMRCHVLRGDRPAALRQYRRCREILRSELEIDPMEETRLLHRVIREDGPPVPGRSEPRRVRSLRPSRYASDDQRRAEELLERVERLLRELHGVTAELEGVMESVRRGMRAGGERDRDGGRPRLETPM